MATIPQNTALISLPLAIWGNGYAQFLPQWWDGVRSLETQPDEIIIVTDEQNYQAVIESAPAWAWVRVIKENLTSYAQYWNKAIKLCGGKWIAICNVDDQFRPRGLDSIPEAEARGCNLVCDAIRTKGTDHVQQTIWNPETLNYEFELGGANPMTKALWQAAGGFPEGIRFADWGLALGMRKSGLVKPYVTSEIRIVYDRGYDRLTLSGALLGAAERAEGREQIKQLVRQYK